MPKLVVTVEDKLLSECSLDDKEILIGRGPDCDIVVRDPLVSRHHAKIAKAYGGYFVEDLKSTNGIAVNGNRVHKQMLKYGDRVQIGTHDLCLTPADIDERGNDAGDNEKTVVMMGGVFGANKRPVNIPISPTPESPAPVKVSPATPPPVAKSGIAAAHVRFLTGPAAGTSDAIAKALYSIGEPGGDLAVISRRGQAYVLQNLGKKRTTTINGEPVPSGAGIPLKSGDRIKVGEAQLEFFLE